MATEQQIKQWEKDMKGWLDDLLEWQYDNPDKDWFEELCKEPEIEAEDAGGERPPTPPPRP